MNTTAHTPMNYYHYTASIPVIGAEPTAENGFGDYTTYRTIAMSGFFPNAETAWKVLDRKFVKMGGCVLTVEQKVI